MRVVLTLRTRDHVDLVDAHLAFHLSAGVDAVVATDHRSEDGTRAVLERYERAGSLVLLRKDEERFTPGTWVNEMARMAVTELGADWVIHSDADEFWWPRGGDLAHVLSAVPMRFGVVRGMWRHFAPRPEDGSHFAERMTVRLCADGPWQSVDHTFHPNVKVAHRGDPATTLRPGSHDGFGSGPILGSWLPLEVLHFPFRTLAQARAKFTAWQPVLERGVDIATHVDRGVEAVRSGTFPTFYDRYVVDDNVLEEGLRTGTLSIDTRLRDALRKLSGDAGSALSPSTRLHALPRGARGLEFPAFDVAQEALLADDAMSLADPIDRARTRVAVLEQRLAALERPSIRRALSRR